MSSCELFGCGFTLGIQIIWTGAYFYRDKVMIFNLTQSYSRLFSYIFRLGDRQKSKHYTELALDQPVVTDDDKKVAEGAENFYRKNFILM